MPDFRAVRAGSAAAMLLAVLTPVAMAEGASAASPEISGEAAPAASAGKNWHRQVLAGKGRRSAKVLTCYTVSDANYTAWFKLTTRSSTDRRYPRVEIDMVDGSHESSSSYSLMPGSRTQTFNSATWSADGVATIKVVNQGKRKTKVVTVASFGAC